MTAHPSPAALLRHARQEPLLLARYQRVRQTAQALGYAYGHRDGRRVRLLVLAWTYALGGAAGIALTLGLLWLAGRVG